MKSQLVRILALISLVLGLAGCQRDENATSEAKEAVVRSGVKLFNDGALVVPWSVIVRQVQEVDEDTQYVLVTFDRLTVERPERCLILYEACRDNFGEWSTGSGGGACGGPVEGWEEIPPIDSSWGSISDSDAPVISSNMAYYGVVHDHKIVKVRFTWNDGAVLDADVINSSYLVMRDGQLDARIEGLDVDGAVVYVDAADIP